MMKYLLFGFAMLPLSLVACGSSNSSTPGNGADGGACSTSSTGSIMVTITGLPAGVNASVTLAGAGTTKTISATSTVSSLPSGNYTVTADIVTQADPIVRKAFKGTASITSASVCDGQTANVDVTYALIPTSNTLWWGDENGATSTVGYASQNLAATGSPAADIAAQTEGALPGAFDRAGNLWVIDGTAESIKRYPADSLASSGSKTPDVVISADAFTGGVPGPASLTFDAKGNLFVGIAFSKTILEFDVSTLAATATLTPSATLTVPDAPNALAFDGDDNLWVGSANDRVLEYAGASGAPKITIEAMTSGAVVGTLTSPLGLAFDSSKNLWVNYNGTFAALTPADRGGSGDVQITPAVQIQADVLSLPEGLAFDESGGLWFAYSAGKFAKFGASQLTASGSVAPVVIVTSASLGSATSPAFYPAPAALPLFDALP